MHTIGEIAINISLFLYLIQYIPQIYHNAVHPHIKNISMVSQTIFFLGIGLDMIYGLGFGYPWQYILVDIVYFIFLSIQQFQIARTNIYNQWINIALFGWVIISSAIALFIYTNGIKVQGDAFSNLPNIGFWFAGTVSTIIWIVLWLPQIAKNMYQKEADGYAKSFWIIGLIKTFCDIASALAFDYTWLNWFASIFSLLVYITLMGQVYYYKQKNQKLAVSI